MYITLPYSMVEPIRELLDAGVQSDRGERDERWEESLREEMMAAKVELRSTLAHVDMTLRDIAHLKVGDVIPLELPDLVEVKAEDMPVFRGQLGVSEGNYAIKVKEWIQHRKRKPLHEFLAEAEQMMADRR
jgi:flagellar motor switch protein FliM